METKRYHPAIMLFGIVKAIKGWIVPLIIVTIFNSADNWWGKYAGYIVLAIILLSILHDILKWFFEKYATDDYAFHLYSGIFTKSSRTVPYEKIQSVTKHKKLMHRLLGLSAIKFETGSQEQAVEFQVLRKAEADRLEQLAKQEAVPTQEAAVIEEELDEFTAEAPQPKVKDRFIHFKPTKKELIKASFTSLSFLIIPPLLVSFLLKADIFFDWSDVRQYLPLLKVWWITGIGLLILIVLSMLIGMWRILQKYGNYELATDDNHIYIRTGLLDESSFSIRKDRVQGIEIAQPLLHRFLGLAKIKLITTGALDLSEDTEEINSLYPYFPLKRAYTLLAEILPEYKVKRNMAKLEPKVLVYRTMQPSIIWLIVTITLFFWRPEVLGFEITWWIAAIVLFCFIELYRYLDFKHTQYVISEKFFQIKSGAFTTTTFVTKRNKMIEIASMQNPLQRWLGLATITSINRAKPVLHNKIKDIPAAEAARFYAWFYQRTEDVRRQ